MHALILPIRRLVPRLRDLPRHADALAETSEFDLLAAAVGAEHADLTVEPLLEVS